MTETSGAVPLVEGLPASTSLKSAGRHFVRHFVWRTAAERPVRRVARAHHLLRLLGARLAFVSQVNRATGETLRQQAAQEGLIRLKAWVKNALDHVIQECMNEPGLEFVWVGDDAIDPLEQAQTLNILVGAGIKTREEARADLGLAPAGGQGPVADDTALKALRKLNPHHDERGQFATADGAVATVGSVARKPQPTRIQVASNDATVRSDAGPSVAASDNSRYAFAGILIDKRYDENINVTHCTYRTPFGTYTHEYDGYVSRPETMPAP